MNELDRWVYFDGPEPESLRPVLGALRDLLPPPTEEDEAQAVARVLAALDAELAPAEGAARDQEGAAPEEGDAAPPTPLPVPEVIARAGTVIGDNDGEPVTTPYDDCVLVMPSTAHAKAGNTVVRLGRFED